MDAIQKLREQRARAAARMDALFARNSDTGEIDYAATDWTDEKEESYQSARTEVANIDQAIERAQEHMRVVAGLPTPADEAVATRIEVVNGSVSVDEAAAALLAYQDAFNAWCRNGLAGVTQEQRELLIARREAHADPSNVQVAGTDSSGGFLVPDTFVSDLIKEMNEIGVVRQFATVRQSDTGRKQTWPATDISTSGAYIRAENATSTDADIVFSEKSLEFDNWNSRTYAASFELLQDNAVNLAAEFPSIFAHWIAQGQNAALVNGSSVSGANIVGFMESPTVSGKTAVSETAVTTDELIDLQHSIKRLYRRNAVWVFHDLTEAALKKLKTTDGIPLWLPGIVADAPDRILGSAYGVDDNMPQMAGDAKSIFYGDLSRYFVIDATDLRFFRFDDSAYTKSGRIGFMAEIRTAGGWVTAGIPGKFLTQA